MSQENTKREFELFFNIINIGSRCHENAVKSLFWEDCNDNNFVMFSRAKIADIYAEIDEAITAFESNLRISNISSKEYKKDTLEVELADSIIRALDLIEAIKKYKKDDIIINDKVHNLSIEMFLKYHAFANFTQLTKHNFYELSPFLAGSSEAIREGNWRIAFGMLILFVKGVCRICVMGEINVIEHINWKLNYNKNRGVKHEKLA
jgi:hypothetical protein